MDEEGFRMVNTITRQGSEGVIEVSTSNIFQVLAEEEITVGKVVCEIDIHETRMGDNPPVQNE